MLMGKIFQEKLAIYGHNEKSGYVRIVHCHLIEKNCDHFTVRADGLCHVLDTSNFAALMILENSCTSEN